MVIWRCLLLIYPSVCRSLDLSGCIDMLICLHDYGFGCGLVVCIDRVG